MSKSFNKIKIGLFVISAIILFVFLLIVFSSNNVFSHNVRFYTFFNTSLNGLDLGAPVKFKGVRVGSVESINIIHDDDTDEACACVLIKIDANAFKTINGRHVVERDYDAFYAEQIAHGMAAKLALDSLVTGKSFVAIDYYPRATERYFKDIEDLKYQQMPSMATNLDEFLASVETLMKNLSNLNLSSVVSNLDDVLSKIYQSLDEIDFKHVSGSFINLCNSWSNLANDERIQKILDVTYSALSKVDTHIDQSFSNFNDVLDVITDMCKSNSYFRERMEECLLQLEKMLRSVREFFDFLERNPNALIAGKAL